MHLTQNNAQVSDKMQAGGQRYRLRIQFRQLRYPVKESFFNDSLTARAVGAQQGLPGDGMQAISSPRYLCSEMTHQFLLFVSPLFKIGGLYRFSMKRFEKLYPGEQIPKVISIRDKNNCDLDLDYHVGDLFESDDVIQIIHACESDSFTSTFTTKNSSVVEEVSKSGFDGHLSQEVQTPIVTAPKKPRSHKRKQTSQAVEPNIEKTSEDLVSSSDHIPASGIPVQASPATTLQSNAKGEHPQPTLKLASSQSTEAIQSPPEKKARAPSTPRSKKNAAPQVTVDPLAQLEALRSTFQDSSEQTTFVPSQSSIPVHNIVPSQQPVSALQPQPQTVPHGTVSHSVSEVVSNPEVPSSPAVVPTPTAISQLTPKPRTRKPKASALEKTMSNMPSLTSISSAVSKTLSETPISMLALSSGEMIPAENLSNANVPSSKSTPAKSKPSNLSKPENEYSGQLFSM